MQLGEWVGATLKLKGEVERRKGGVSSLSRGAGPLKGWRDELSMTGKCQGVERQEVGRASSLPVPRTEVCADSHPVGGEREDGIWRRGGVFSKMNGYSLSWEVKETQLRCLSWGGLKVSYKVIMQPLD